MVKKIYLWYSESTQDTGRKLANMLNIKYHGKELPHRKYKYILTYGCRLPQGINKNTIERLKRQTLPFNNIMSIESNASNKHNTLKLLNRKKVSVPKNCKATRIKRMLKEKKIKYPVIGRTKQHFSGSGFYLCLQKRDINLCIKKVNHFLEFIPIKKEYRIHVFYNNPIRYSVKIPSTSCDKWIRTNSKGWKFKEMSKSKIPDSIIKESIKALKCVNLNYGAIDIIQGEDNKPYVLEVNSAPSLNKKGREKYIAEFKALLDKLL